MKAETGFSDDSQGIKKYIDICKKNGLLPVGCGNYYDCNYYRHSTYGAYGEPCLPMPSSWGCDMMSNLKANTRWDNNIVAMEYYWGYLRTPNGNPAANKNLQAVCGKVAGIF